MSERSSVQKPLLRYAGQIGWDYVSPPEALRLRGGEGSLYFTGILASQLQKLNPGVVDSARAGEILRKLSLLRPSIEGNRDALSWLRGEQSVFVPEEKRERNVRLIDFDHPQNNIFQVTEEWTQKNAAFTNRADAVFLINPACSPGRDQERREEGRPGRWRLPDPPLPCREPGDAGLPPALRGHPAHQVLLRRYLVISQEEHLQLEGRGSGRLRAYRVKSFFDQNRFL